MIKRLIAKASNKQNLTIAEAYQALSYFTGTEATDAQIAALLMALKMKGETVDELTGFACAMREKALPVKYTSHEVFDCCGTGGDLASTINVSTASAIVAAACGVYIAKHSNKSITSMCGSSDVLQELGIPLCVEANHVYNQLDTSNIAFLHAPSFHNSTKRVAGIRKELGTRTIFNLLGPLTNPVMPDGQLLGVSSPELCSIVIEVLKNLKTKRALVVCASRPRLDELSIAGPTMVYELDRDNISSYELNPEDAGIQRASIDKVKGSDPAANAVIINDILESKITDARRDIVLLNAGALLYIAGKAGSIKEGVNIAAVAVKTGKAYEKLLILQSDTLFSKNR